jgi:cysteine desulfurase
MSNKVLFFDSASTTPCNEAALELMRSYGSEHYGNPASNHALGKKAARAIREARVFFANTFQVEPEQVIFTGSGTEACNLAIYGTALHSHRFHASLQVIPQTHILTTPIEHPAVSKTIESLADFNISHDLIPIDSNCQLVSEKFLGLLKKKPFLISIQQVNQIVGAVLPVEELAQLAKQHVPQVLFHTDAIQAFGKISTPRSPSAIDLVSISGHKVEGPKGVGALIVLNKKLLQKGLRPLIWGGGQENGFRSGTQNAGLIAGFHAAAAQTLQNQKSTLAHLNQLRAHFRDCIIRQQTKAVWNSPTNAAPHLISLSFPRYPASPLAKLLEERNCIVSVGSACSSRKIQPDAVLKAMGLPKAIQESAIRVSLSRHLNLTDMEVLAKSLDQALQMMDQLL